MRKEVTELMRAADSEPDGRIQHEINQRSIGDNGGRADHEEHRRQIDRTSQNIFIGEHRDEVSAPLRKRRLLVGVR